MTKKIEDGGPDFPKDGSWFTTETVVHTTYRWKPYKPQAVRQLGKKGRWQKMVWHGDFFKWENCDDPTGVLVPEEGTSAARQAEALQRENAELRAVMKECHAALKMMVAPGDISGSTVLGAFAAAKSAEARARALLGGENAE